MGLIGNVLINLMARTASFDQSMCRSRGHVTAFGRASMQARATVAAFRSAILRLAGVGGVLAGLGKSIKLAMAQEEAERDLAAALEGVGVNSKAAMGGLKSFASALEGVTRHGDDAILAMQTLLVNVGGLTGEGLKKATVAAIGLAARLKLDLNTAAQLVARAAKGQTSTLTRYGIVLSQTADKEAAFNELLEIGAKSFTLAEESAKTLAGQLDQVENAAGNMGKAFGQIFTEAGNGRSILESLTGHFQNVAGALNALRQTTDANPFEQMIGGLASALGLARHLNAEIERTRQTQELIRNRERFKKASERHLQERRMAERQLEILEEELQASWGGAAGAVGFEARHGYMPRARRQIREDIARTKATIADRQAKAEEAAAREEQEGREAERAAARAALISKGPASGRAAEVLAGQKAAAVGGPWTRKYQVPELGGPGQGYKWKTEERPIGGISAAGDKALVEIVKNTAATVKRLDNPRGAAAVLGE